MEGYSVFWSKNKENNQDVILKTTGDYFINFLTIVLSTTDKIKYRLIDNEHLQRKELNNIRIYLRTIHYMSTAYSSIIIMTLINKKIFDEKLHAKIDHVVRDEFEAFTIRSCETESVSKTIIEEITLGYGDRISLINSYLEVASGKPMDAAHGSLTWVMLKNIFDEEYIDDIIKNDPEICFIPVTSAMTEIRVAIHEILK